MKKSFILAVAIVLTVTTAILTSCGENSANDKIGILKDATGQVDKLATKVNHLTKEAEKIYKKLQDKNFEPSEAQEDSIQTRSELLRKACKKMEHAVIDLNNHVAYHSSIY